MPDILIRGLDMPKDGRKHTALLQFLENGKCRAIVEYSKSYDDRSVKVFEAVPLPEGHGRLIDADALQAKFELMENALAEHGRPYSFAFKDGGEMCAEWWTVQDALAREPTIVPAEGGGEE